MKIARVFPRKTNASPDDSLAFFGPPAESIGTEIDEVHISVTWTHDVTRAAELAESWKHIASVRIGGPAMGDRGGDFVPGQYLKNGYVITSRGCPNNCWFCDVPKREGSIRELTIVDGWNLLDSNILACSEKHIREVFAMLKTQKHPVQLSGGLEAARLKPWHVSLLWDLRPKQMFFAYDTPDDFEPLFEAGKLLRHADFTRNHMRCYVLLGWPADTFDKATKRLLSAWHAGFMPMAMLWMDRKGNVSAAWKQFQRQWGRPAIIKSTMKQLYARGH